MSATTIRDIYHAVRRAGTVHSAYNSDSGTKHSAYRDHSMGRLRAVRVPRGFGALRDQAIEAVRSTGAGADSLASPVAERLKARLVRVYRSVIAARGGETVISERSRDVTLRMMDREADLVLLGCDGWRQYSRAFGARHASLRYLCGRDDNGRWAVRVPATCNTVSAAMDFVEPADVKRARGAGRSVLRQGDVYLIEQSRDNLDALAGTRHRWDARTRTLHHDDPTAQHGALHVPFRAKAVVQSVLRMGRETGRRRGD